MPLKKVISYKGKLKILDKSIRLPYTISMSYLLLMQKFKNIAKMWTDFEKRPHNFDGQRLYNSEIYMLMIISKNPKISITNIAKIAKMTKGTISELVKKLEKKGLVKKTQSPDNASKLSLDLTKNGQKIIKIHDRIHEEMDMGFKKDLENLSTENIKIIEELFTKAENFLIKMEKEET